MAHVQSRFIDLPGHGGDRGRPATSIDEYAQLLSPSIDQACIVVGHSMGGLIGIELAAKNQHVKALVLVASHFSLPVHPAVLSTLAEGTFPEGLFYASYSKRANAELLEQEKREVSHVPIATTFADFDCCNRYLHGLETFSALNLPVLALYGEEDRLLPMTAKEDLLHANPNAQAQMIEGAGHYLMLEKPQEFVSALRNGEIFKRQMFFIAGTKIEAVGPHLEASDCEVIDAANMMSCPVWWIRIGTFGSPWCATSVPIGR